MYSNGWNPARGETALREQRQALDPGVQMAQLPPGPVVRMDPIPDGSTYAEWMSDNVARLAAALKS